MKKQSLSFRGYREFGYMSVSGIMYLSVVVFLLSTGCHNVTDVMSTAPDEDFHAKKTEIHISKSMDLPMHGKCETVFDPPVFLRPPSVFSQIDTGTCQLSHLGKSSFYSVKEIDFSAGTQKTTEAWFKAANGDILYATGEGMSSPGEAGKINFNAVLQFTGGTGRFEGATGSINVQGTADVVNRTAVLSLSDGRISYLASNRRDDQGKQ